MLVHVTQRVSYANCMQIRQIWRLNMMYEERPSRGFVAWWSGALALARSQGHRRKGQASQVPPSALT